MKYLCQGTLEIDVDGMVFAGADFTVSQEAVISDQGADAWNLVIRGQEQEFQRLGEACAPWISIDGIFFGELSQLDGEGVHIEWDRDLKIVNRTYFTLFGEGFPLWTGKLSLRRSGRNLHLALDGGTNYPLDGITNIPISHRREFFPIRTRGYGEASEP